MRARATLTFVIAAVWLALPSLADASVWKEGTASSSFTLSDSGGLVVVADGSGDPAITVPYEASTMYDGASIEFEPRSVRVAKDGSYLVACGKHGYILKVSPSGKVRKYTSQDIEGLERPFDAFPLDNGGMLVVDRGADQGEGRVIRVDSSNKVVWRYGVAGGLGAGQIWDPFTAEPIAGGHTLIADSLGYRVIEIDNKSGAIVWSYGTFRVEGPGTGLLVRPHSAQRLGNGNTLICDSEDQKVIEVTPDRRVVWSYGTGVAGSGPGQLKGANSARRLANGNTMICDSDNSRVIEVDKHGNIVEEFGVAGRTNGPGALNDPRASVRLADGSTVIADLGNQRLARFRYRPRREYTATSGLIDPAIGKMKWFSRITVDSLSPPGTLVAAEYATDGRTWMSVPESGKLPASTKGSAIRYRVRLTTGDGDAAPVVEQVSITWSDTAPSTGSGDSGSGGSRSSGGGGSGSHTSTSGSGSRTVIAGGTGTILSSIPVPGGSAEIGGGGAGGTGTGLGEAVTQSTPLSGWVMKEVHDEVGGALVSSKAGAFGSGSALEKSTAPGLALVFIAYAVGLFWSPASQLVVRVVVSAMAR